MASLDKWLSIGLQSQWLSFWILFQSLKLQISRLLLARSSLTFRQLQTVYSLRMWHTVSFLSLLYFLSMFTYVQKYSSPRVDWVPNLPLRYAQTGGKRNVRKSLRRRLEKTASQKHITTGFFIVCLYLSSLFLKLLMEGAFTISKGKLFQLFTTRLFWRKVFSTWDYVF